MIIKRIFNRSDVHPEEVNVEQDPESLDRIKSLGYLSVPVVEVIDENGNTIDHFSGIIPDKIDSVIERVTGTHPKANMLLAS